MKLHISAHAFCPNQPLRQHIFQCNIPAFALRDETVCGLSGSAYLSDISLRGEFVRAVSADQELSDEMKTQIIRRGLAALSGDSGRL